MLCQRQRKSPRAGPKGGGAKKSFASVRRHSPEIWNELFFRRIDPQLVEFSPSGGSPVKRLVRRAPQG